MMFESNGEHLALQLRHCHGECEPAVLVWRIDPSGEPTLIRETTWSGVDHSNLSPFFRDSPDNDEIVECGVYDFVHRSATFVELPRPVPGSTEAICWSPATPSRRWRQWLSAVRKSIFR
jgi:hypothetical protein